MKLVKQNTKRLFNENLMMEKRIKEKTRMCTCSHGRVSIQETTQLPGKIWYQMCTYIVLVTHTMLVIANGKFEN